MEKHLPHSLFRAPARLEMKPSPVEYQQLKQVCSCVFNQNKNVCRFSTAYNFLILPSTDISRHTPTTYLFLSTISTFLQELRTSNVWKLTPSLLLLLLLSLSPSVSTSCSVDSTRETVGGHFVLQDTGRWPTSPRSPPSLPTSSSRPTVRVKSSLVVCLNVSRPSDVLAIFPCCHQSLSPLIQQNKTA